MKKKNKESLVTDQPARKVIFSGLILSLLLGFFVRGLTKPEVLQSELQSAVGKIHSSTDVSWGSAVISLKNGWLPRFSILIRDVKIVSSETCWGTPLLYARELELPVSLLSFFERGQPLQKIYIRDAFLEMKSNFICNSKSKVVRPTTPEKDPPVLVRLKPLSHSQETPPLVLTDFIFENLKVRQSEWVFPNWNFNNLELSVKENHPWYAEVKSDFSIPDMEGVETGAHLTAVYKEFPSQVLEIKVNGHWREGTFKVNGSWEGAQKGWSYQSQFNHIPFQFLKSVAQRTHTPWNWPDKPMWFSFSTKTVVPFTDWNSSQHFVKQLDIEGDLGEFSIPNLEIKSWSPFKVSPFAFNVQPADLTSALVGQNLKKIGLFSSLGKLSGQGQWSSEKDMLFSGRVEKMKIPFFHRDQKYTQTIQFLNLEAQLKSGLWKMSFQNLNLDHGNSNLSLTLEGNQDLSSGQARSQIEALQMAPEVYKILDIQNTDLTIQGKLSARWKQNKIQDLSSQFKANQLQTSSFSLVKPVLTIKKISSLWDFKLQSPLFSLQNLSFVGLGKEAESDLKFPYDSKLMLAHLTLDNQKNIKWKVSSSVIRSEGLIDSGEGIKGILKLGTRSQEKTLEITGTRQTPLLK